jgi:flagellar motility protein MotE (MotC chaperone)
MKILNLIPAVFTYFCVATVLALGVGVTFLWARGSLDEEKLFRVLAVVHDVDLDAAIDEAEELRKAVEDEQPALDDIIEARAIKSLDLDLRESALTKGLVDLLSLEARLQTEQDRYKQLKGSFDDLLAKMEGQKSDSALQEVQRTLEAMQPKQAKDQILKMLEDDAMHDVVTIMKGMPIDKRKKIAGEFKTGDEPDKLHEILTQIRLGVPGVTLIRDTRKQLEQVDAAGS